MRLTQPGDHVVIRNPGEAPASVVDRVMEALGAVRSLEAVLDWGRSQSRPRDVTAIVTQDEYTHDVVFEYEPPWYLVFDVT